MTGVTGVVTAVTGAAGRMVNPDLMIVGLMGFVGKTGLTVEVVVNPEFPTWMTGVNLLMEETGVMTLPEMTELPGLIRMMLV